MCLRAVFGGRGQVAAGQLGSSEHGSVAVPQHPVRVFLAGEKQAYCLRSRCGSPVIRGVGTDRGSKVRLSRCAAGSGRAVPPPSR